jgi:predicted alpha/beta superfamily hydrolase
MTQEDLGEIAVGEKFTFASETLGEERPFWVSLPASYNESTHAALGYPVLYLLDGDAHFHPTSGVVRHMSTGWNGNFQIPELIIVAILNTDRTRDLTPTHTKLSLDGKESEFLKSSGGAGKFL